jgi:tetratricopeptide (TPR) repeat protein
MNILNLLDKAIEMLDSSSKAINLFKQLMDLSHKITRAEHSSSEEDVKQYYRIHDELVKEPKEAIARAYQVNTKIPPTTDTNIVAHYYDDAMQYIQKLGYNIDLLRKKATKEEMGKDEGRCWEGYEPVAGVPAYEKGSCQKKMEEIQEVIGMLDKAINFYDPTQARDESGRWAGGAGEYGSNKSGTSFVTDAQEQILTNKTDVIKVIQDHHERALKNVTGEDDEPAVSDALDRVESVMEAIDQARQEQPQKFYEILGRASDKVQAISRQIGKSSSKAVSQNAGYFENLADAINEIAGVWSDKTSDTWYRK